jgi:FkbM family methyltransferase
VRDCGAPPARLSITNSTQLKPFGGTLTAMSNLAAKLMRRLGRGVGAHPDRFLRSAHGIVHVGANVGQEREVYARHGLPVLWIEPIPEVFATLQANLRGFDLQRAVECLITDRDDAEYEFHVANNDGMSSSILDLKEHKDVHPNIRYTKTIKLRSTTLATLLERERIDPKDYDALVMDTQGSELLVLEGAEAVLSHFRFIKTEAADFEAYAGCALLRDIESFVTSRGYVQLARQPIAKRAAGGYYYDVIYARIA